MLKLTCIALVVVTVWALFVTYALFVNNPLPWPDRGGSTFTTASPAAFRAMIKLFKHFGWVPRFKVDATGIERVMYPDGLFLNYTDPALRERMGNPVAGKAFVVKDPVKAAREAVRILTDAGFEAHTLPHFTDDVKSTDLVAVGTTALPQWILVFRKHMLKLGPPPPRWEE